MKNRHQIFVTNQVHLRAILDIVMKTLFENADKNGLNLEKDIFRPLDIKLPAKEVDKVWEVIINSGLINPIVGFGNSGKVELTSEGVKMMSQYGGYLNFLAQTQPNNFVIQNPASPSANNEEQQPTDPNTQPK